MTNINNKTTQFWKNETISQAKALALRENAIKHFHNDKPYTEKDEAERLAIINPVCPQCNQSGHSFCNKD